MDLYSVREDRQRYNSLKNDHLQLTDAIQEEVNALLSVSDSKEEEQEQRQRKL